MILDYVCHAVGQWTLSYVKEPYTSLSHLDLLQLRTSKSFNQIHTELHTWWTEERHARRNTLKTHTHVSGPQHCDTENKQTWEVNLLREIICDVLLQVWMFRCLIDSQSIQRNICQSNKQSMMMMMMMMRDKWRQCHEKKSSHCSLWEPWAEPHAWWNHTGRTEAGHQTFLLCITHQNIHMRVKAAKLKSLKCQYRTFTLYDEWRQSVCGTSVLTHRLQAQAYNYNNTGFTYRYSIVQCYIYSRV